MDQSCLKINPDKTEFMIFGSSRKQNNLSHVEDVTLLDTTIKRSKITRYLGAFMDQSLSFDTHFIKKSALAMWNIMKIRRIRKYLTVDSAKIIVHALVLSHLDYVNGILFGTTDKNINKFQRIQNISAKLILGKGKYDSASDCLRNLHWLPIKARFDFKILLLVYKCLNQLAPPYLSCLLTRSADAKKHFNIRTRNAVKFEQLEIPRVQRKTFPARSFSVSGPTLWNNLRIDIRQAENTDTFKKLLKTHLFQKYLTNCSNSDDIYMYY